MTFIVLTGLVAAALAQVELDSRQLHIAFDGRECNGAITAPCPAFSLSAVSDSGEVSTEGILWSYRAVQEIDADGNVVSDDKDIDELPADYQVVEEPLTGDGVTGTYINLTAGDAAFGEVCPACENTTMTFEHFLVEDGSLTFAAASSGANVEVPEGAFKFSMQISGWPWDANAASGHALRVLFRLRTMNQRFDDVRLVDIDDDHKSLQLGFLRSQGEAQFELLTKAVAGGDPVSVDIEMDDSDDRNIFLAIELPYPGDDKPNTLLYDPVATASGAAHNGPVLLVAIVALVISLLVL